MSQEIIFRDDVTVELVKASASDADVIWAARVSTAGEQSMDEIGEDPARSAGLINYLTSAATQNKFVKDTLEYSLISGAQAPVGVIALEKIGAPTVDLKSLTNIKRTQDLLI